MNFEMMILRAIHIGGGTIWAGWVLSMAMFVEPAVRAIVPAGGVFMQALIGKTTLVKVMAVVPVLVVLTGLRLLWVVSGGFDAGWVETGHGVSTLVGSSLGLLMFIYGFVVLRPKATKIGMLSAKIAATGKPSIPDELTELRGLSASLRKHGVASAWLMGVTILFMAISRYIQ